ncbi:hypothetical protein [Variovorax sp. LG9.2]|uniref:hypothetical protein n=1 Tax=Variovorax sp. LG9.2 TaxID=3048626 RepID=UPI002B22777D|nr:hypothetical protein [Variovorax sp. LG9.2]MEB0056713.1 hypothetical protein [Variovorax sp. LG9.2]
MGWFFHVSDPMGGAAGEAYANTLASPGMPPAHVLAREAIQNSCDAGNGNKVAVRFRSDALSGARKATFVEAAGLMDLAARIEELKLTSPNCLHTLDKPRAALPLLYVEDYNAVGLTGEPHDSQSNFYRLLLSLGDRSEVETAKGSRGGSYGFGKSVYSSSSKIRTIFAYTRFKAENGKEITRVFGCGYFVSHRFKKNPYSGRAWLGGKPREDDLGRVVIDPLENATADALATKLGFKLRKAGETGTSILIVDAHVDTTTVIRGVEEWWWPRLEDGKLDVEFLDADGTPHYPKPKKNEALRPFIEAFEIAKGRAAAKSGTQKYAAFNREDGVLMGGCGFVVAPVAKDGTLVVPGNRLNAVALIREPHMVVAYHVVSQALPAVVGVYLAPDEKSVEEVLRKSEPPAHDRWDPDSENLRDESGKRQKMVRSILSRIQQGLRRFQGEASPPAQAKERRLNQLERSLGGWFRPRGAGSQNPDASPSPLHLEFLKPAYAEATDDGKLRLRSTFAIRLDSSSELDSVDLRLKLNCPVMEDDNEEGEDLDLNVSIEGVKAQVDESDPLVYRFTLPKNVKAKFKVESAPYDAAWTVRLRPDFERESEL